MDESTIAGCSVIGPTFQSWPHVPNVLDVIKLPWYIDLLNVNLGITDLAEAQERIGLLRRSFEQDGTRITENLDFLSV